MGKNDWTTYDTQTGRVVPKGRNKHFPKGY